MKRSSIVIRTAIVLALALPLAACSPQGAPGETGPAGTDGANGAQGAQGPAGIAGPAGPMGPQGATGSAGATGATGTGGATGATGPAGAAGATGATGPAGAIGPAGAAGAPGLPGAAGAQGIQGTAGSNGATGAPGAVGPAGSGVAALFYAMSPPDNATTVAPGNAVLFPQDGPSTTTSLARSSASSFEIDTAGVYRVTAQVSISEPGQLVLTVNGVELDYTVVGRSTGTSQIVMSTLVTVAAGDILSLNNPAGSSLSLTVSALAGGTQAASATLLIELVK